MEEDEIEDDIVYEEVLEDGEGDEDDLQDYCTCWGNAFIKNIYSLACLWIHSR